MKKNLILTRSDKRIEEMSNITHPILKSYAKKCNADFKIIENSKGIHPHYRIMQLYDLFEKYYRILVLDTDIIIMPDCVNLFNLVPESFDVASIFEDIGSRKTDRRKRIKDIQYKFGSVGWKKGYINTGVALFNKSCKEIFKYNSEKELWMDLGYDDVYLGYQINKLKLKIFELPLLFNLMSMFTESWCGLSKGDSYIIHYAGNGFFPYKDRIKQMKEDFNIIYER